MSQVNHAEYERFRLRGNGDPNTRADVAELFSARVGSTWARNDGSTGSALYVCTKAGVPPSGAQPGQMSVWVAIA
jgi:hypothetical protein